MRIRKTDVLFGVLTLLLCGFVVGLALAEVDSRVKMRDRFDSMNHTLDTIGRR